MKNTVTPQEKKPTRRELLEQWRQARSSMTTPKKFISAAPKPARFEDLLRSEDRMYPQGDPTFRFRLGKLSMSKSTVSSVKKLSTVKQFDWLDYKEIPTLSSRLERAFGADLRFPQFTADSGRMDECHVQNSFPELTHCSQDFSYPRAMKVNTSRLTEIQNEMTMKDTDLESEGKNDQQSQGTNQKKENINEENRAFMKIKEEKSNVKRPFESKKTPVQSMSKPPSCSKKRKEREFGDDKENDAIMMGRGSLKKVLLNENPEKSSCSKTEQIKINFDMTKTSQSGAKKDFQEPKGKDSPMAYYGSGMKFSAQKGLKDSNVIEKVVTPVRASPSLSSKTPVASLQIMSRDKIVSENDSKPSVTFSEQHNEVSYTENNLEDMFKPLDEITSRLREMNEMIKHRRPTPYSKPTERLEEDEEAGNENQDDSKDSKMKRYIPMTDLGMKRIESYNVLEVKEVSALKKGFRDLLTPFKDITNDQGDNIAPVFDSLSKNIEENGELARNSSDISKRLDSFY